MFESDSAKIKRRHFLAGALGAAPALGVAGALKAAEPEKPATSSVPAQSPVATENTPPSGPKITVDYPGSDFMVDVIKTLDIEYISAVPGSSFRGLQESFVNHGGNTKPEWVCCLHEDTAVGIAHGYAKMSGKPMMTIVHGVVGLQHTPMALYNAFADQAPIILMAGNTANEGERRGNADWQHSALDQGSLVRDITKWDDQPYSMQGFAESMVRAYDMATTVPKAPVLIVANGELQEEELPPEERKKLIIPTLKQRTPPAGESGAVREAAKWLVDAENPVIIADRYCRTSAGMDILVKLAETLQAPVIDRLSRLNFPTRHPLNHTGGAGGAVGRADVILVLEPADIFSTFFDTPDTVTTAPVAKAKPDAKIIRIGTDASINKANFNTFMRYIAADLVIPGDGEATVPTLTEEIAKLMNGSSKTKAGARGKQLREQGPRFLDNARKNAAFGWNSSPISLPRLSAEIWAQIKDEDWAAGALSAGMSGWPARLWNFTKPFQAIGGQGGGGLGYSSPAAVGAALANKKANRLTIGIVGDGDFNMAPGVMWTAVQMKLPLLMIIQNNGGYYQEVMHLQRMAGQRCRGIDRATKECLLVDPPIDYTKLAQGYGAYAEGPIRDPNELAPALKRAIAHAKNGEPALLDVVAQPR